MYSCAFLRIWPIKVEVLHVVLVGQFISCFQAISRTKLRIFSWCKSVCWKDTFETNAISNITRNTSFYHFEKGYSHLLQPQNHKWCYTIRSLVSEILVTASLELSAI